MQRFAVANSDGAWVEGSMPLLYLRVNAIATKDGRRGMGMERVSFRLGAEQMDGDAAGKAGQKAGRMAVAMLDAEAAPAGEMPVILAAGGGVLFHEAVGHGLEGDGVRRGSSFFAGRVGEVVGSERVSVVDWGGIADLRGSYDVDDEGTAPVKSVLIERGVLRGFMNDRMTAGVLEAERTGNGRRQSYRFPPLVRMSNTYLPAGEDDVEEMIRATPSGLYARTLGGGEVDTTTGNFTFGVLEAYRIEDGKLGRAVRGANLVGNGPEILKRIDRVGPDLEYWPGTCGKGQWVPITAGAPTLRIASMTVGGSA
jgi:TldD protein